MSKSNNNHCTPDNIFGEQKGENSPFFHIPSKENLRKYILDNGLEIDFLSTDNLQEFSTFFHEEKIKKTSKHLLQILSERQKRFETIQKLITTLSVKISDLATMLASPPNPQNSLSNNCASLSVLIFEKEKEIRTNIIINLTKEMFEFEFDSTFLQAKKECFFLEHTAKILGFSLPSLSNIKYDLQRYAPNQLVSWLSCAIQQYEDTENFLSPCLVSAAKYAKKADTASYLNLLRSAAVRLHDTARLLLTIGKEDTYAKIHTCT